MIYNDAVNYIHSLLKFGIRPGLNGMDTLLRMLGDPHKKMKFVHVAGTNGKGSTSTAISNILCEAGYKTGLYTSPYVTDFLERVQFCAKPVPREVFAESVEKVRVCVDSLKDRGVVITEFEALTAAAFLCYKALLCDVVVLEVGLGGRLDATNVIDTPLVGVITSLSIDHSSILGDTIEKIAFEKCGIIKKNGKVISSFGQPEQALSVIKERTAHENATLIIPMQEKISVLKSDIFGTKFLYNDEEYFVPMAGEHQLKNMTCAIECARALSDEFNISQANIKTGIAKTVLPARVEVISRNPLVVLDGGHNTDGARAFFNAVLPEIECHKKIVVISGMMADKQVENSLSSLLGKCDLFFAVTPDNPRSMPAEQLAEIAAKYTKAYAFSTVDEALEEVWTLADEDTAVFVVGSLYLAGEVRGKLTEMFPKQIS